MLSLKPAFSLSSFTLIKRIFSSSSLYAIRMVSPAYLRLLIFLLAILIPASDSFKPSISAHKLNKQGYNIQPCCTPVPTVNQSIFQRLVLTVASSPIYRFFKREVRWFGTPITAISLRIFQFAVRRTVKGSSIINEADVFPATPSLSP